MALNLNGSPTIILIQGARALSISFLPTNLNGPPTITLNVPHGRTCTNIIACFYEKTIISKENRRVECYLLLKYCRRQCTLLPPTRAKSRTKSNPQMQDFKRILDINCKKMEK